MSSMLEQAIIDAEALKEAAKKSAEEKIVEHFSSDIKDAINMILEQDELVDAAMAAVDPAAGDPMAMPEIGAPTIDMESQPGADAAQSITDQTPYAATTSDDEFVSIDLDKLEESVARALNEEGLEETPQAEGALEEEYDLAEDLDFLEEDAETFTLEEEESLEEMIRSALAEEQVFEGAGTAALKQASKLKKAKETLKPSEEEAEEKSKPEAEEGAAEESKITEIIQERNLLDLMYREQLDAVDQLTETNKKYRTLIEQMEEKINEVNLSNAKLLYQNRVLNSVSLNERQKDRIVESITNANTVEEAKIIYETLQSAVGANAQQRKPKSLNEVVTKRSSAFVPRREEKREDPFMARMKALAGIKD